MGKTIVRIFARSFLASAMLVALGCSAIGQAPRRDGEAVISVAPIVRGEIIEAPKGPAPEELYYGEGDCAPKFSNGMRGTCIGGKPCNGFGFKQESGAIECRCFDVKAGCADGLICSTRSRACLPLNKAERLPRVPAH
jgi:hypothetical protein